MEPLKILYNSNSLNGSIFYLGTYAIIVSRVYCSKLQISQCSSSLIRALQYAGPRHAKTYADSERPDQRRGHMRAVMAQISLRIHTVWSGPSLSTTM